MLKEPTATLSMTLKILAESTFLTTTLNEAVYNIKNVDTTVFVSETLSESSTKCP